jgi:cholesterol transport system auxiliary component
MKRLALALLLTTQLAGCLGGASTPSRTYYVLQDRAPAEMMKPRATSGRSLIVAGSSADVFYDAESLVFSRHPGQRAYYQFASWTDRPSHMVGRLAERRLDAGGQFASVARLSTGLRADLLLNIVVVEFYHDVAVNPAVVRVELIGELIDWRSRSLLAQRTFVLSVPVKKDDAEGAVDAFDRAITDVLNTLVPWVETEAAKAAAASG